MNIKKNNLKKLIKYRATYSGMKETDILYKKLILTKLEILDEDELILLSFLFNEISDTNIYNILTNKIPKPKKFKNLINKILYE